MHLILVSPRRGKTTFSHTKLGWFWQTINNYQDFLGFQFCTITEQKTGKR